MKSLIQIFLVAFAASMLANIIAGLYVKTQIKQSQQNLTGTAIDAVKGFFS